MDNCIFCEIVAGNIPSFKVYEDENFLAFLDISQVTKGHTLVIPKKHYKNIFDIDEDTMAQAYKIVNRLAKRIANKLGATGMNILQNSEEVAGQTVDHFHIHIIPRYELSDSIDITFNESDIDVENTYNLLKED